MSSRLFKVLMILSIIGSVFCIPIQISGTGAPHAIIGYALDMDSIGVKGVTVFVNNTRTADSLNMTTDSLGMYSIDIDAYTNGYLPGDVLSLTAVYNGHSSSGTLALNPEPYQLLNLTLDFRAHVIDGYIKRADGVFVRNFSVTITNDNTHESKIYWTDQGGYYRLELSAFPGGYAPGDGVSAYVNQSGFSGMNFTTVTSNPRDRINVTVLDEQKPAPILYEAPTYVNLSQSFRILAWVTDNHAIAGVKLYMKKGMESMFTEYSMIMDDGGVNDWNGNGMVNPQIWGQSTARNLPVPTTMGDFLFYIMTWDLRGNVATLPASNPVGNPYNIHVIDNVSPTIFHNQIPKVEVGSPTEILAIASDNIGIGAVDLFYTGVGESSPTKVKMMPTGDPNTYNASIPAQPAIGAASYRLVCNDTSNNTVRLPAVGSYTLDVVDTVTPQIVHTKINTANVGVPINITCQVKEILLSKVWLNYTDVHGVHYDNIPMAFDDISGKWYYLNETGQNATGPNPFFYTIWANDTSGNQASISNAFRVYDVGTPTIYHEPPEFIEYNQSAIITAFVEDDVEIKHVNLTYKSDGDLIFSIMNMTSTDTDGKKGNYSAVTPRLTSTFMYFINVTDNGTNHMTWPSMADFHEIEVRDTVSPVLSDLAYQIEAPSALGADVSVNVTDAHSVASVKIFYLNSTAASWASIELASTAPLTFEGTVPPHPPGQVKFFIAANDPSGNNATLPGTAPKLNPFLINFTDDSPPELKFALPGSIGVNCTSEGLLNVTDDISATSVEVHFKGIGSGTFIPLDMTKLNPSSYRFTIPGQMKSGQVELYARASDGRNTNQTAVHIMNITNAAPVLEHMPPGIMPLDVDFAITVKASDDLMVEKVEFEWMLSDGVSETEVMNSRGGGFYRTNLSFSEPAIIQYRIIAYDNETSSQWPETGFQELRVLDIYPPAILHVPLQNLTTDQLPIITATVTDNKLLTSVSVRYKNNTSESFQIVPMSQVYGTDDYAVVLEKQPEGNFTYCIEAVDGSNTARSPVSGYHSVFVERLGGNDWTPALIITVVLILLAVAFVLVILHFRRKSIK